jgi:hypothetical protein
MSRKPKPKDERREMIGTLVPPSVRKAIETLADKEERTVSAMAARILEQSPEIQTLLRKRRRRTTEATMQEV